MIRFGPAGAADSFAAMGYKKTAQMPEIGKEYRFEKNVVIRFLGPLKNYKEANNNSLVVQLAYGKNRFLFMIWLPLNNTVTAINLFQQYQPH